MLWPVTDYSKIQSKTWGFLLGNRSELCFPTQLHCYFSSAEINSVNSGQRKEWILPQSHEAYLQWLLCCCFFPLSTSNSLCAGSPLRRGQDTNTLLQGSRGSLTDAVFQSEKKKKNATMTEYEHMEMNPISPARDGGFFLPSPPTSLSPSCLSATLNNSLTVRADLAHRLTDKYLKRKAVRWEQSALFTSQANTPLVCDGGTGWGLGRGWGGLLEPPVQ